MEKKIWIEKNYNKNFNQQIIMNFRMTKCEPYFSKSLSWSFFIGLIFFPLKMYVKELSRWATFHMDFIN